jgi:hypothetical protein
LFEVLNNSVLNCAGNATVGLNASKLGMMSVLNTAVANIAHRLPGRTLFVGRNASASGYLKVGEEGSFAGGTLNVWGNMQVGSAGNGTLQQLTGSNVRVRTAGVNSGRLFIGTSTGAFGSVYVDAGTLTVDDSIFVGGDASGAGGVGFLSIGDGSALATPTAVVNTPGLTAWTATGDTSSGVNLNQGGTLNIGARGLSLGRLDVYGGTLTVLRSGAAGRGRPDAQFARSSVATCSLAICTWMAGRSTRRRSSWASARARQAISPRSLGRRTSRH